MIARDHARLHAHRRLAAIGENAAAIVIADRARNNVELGAAVKEYSASSAEFARMIVADLAVLDCEIAGFCENATAAILAGVPRDHGVLYKKIGCQAINRPATLMRVSPTQRQTVDLDRRSGETNFNREDAEPIARVRRLIGPVAGINRDVTRNVIRVSAIDRDGFCDVQVTLR